LFVANNRVKAQGRTGGAQQIENAVADFGQIVFSVEEQRGLFALRAEGFDSGKVRVGEHFLAQLRQLF